MSDLNFDVNTQNKNGWTALHCAARKNLKNVIEYLMERGADINIKDEFERTAVDYINKKH